MTVQLSTGLLDLELFLFGSTMGAPHGLYSSENHENKAFSVLFHLSITHNFAKGHTLDPREQREVLGIPSHGSAPSIWLTWPFHPDSNGVPTGDHLFALTHSTCKSRTAPLHPATTVAHPCELRLCCWCCSPCHMLPFY